MLIKDLFVEGVGRFVGAARVEGFEPGVNVLAAVNEAGKSTLFKATRACLFSRHDSKNQDIRDLASEGSQLPATVRLTFSQNGRTYVIRKSFLRSPSASLTEDGREVARGKQADDAVWDILGVHPGAGRTVDDGAFGLLWVGQRASFSVPALGGGASDLLNAAIESEVGALVGGERARQMAQSVTTDLRTYLTNTERAKADGPLGRALAEAERWRGVEEGLAAKLAAMEAQFGELANCRRRYDELNDPAAAQALTQQLAYARSDLNEAREAAREIGRCEAEENAAKSALDAAVQRLSQHVERAVRLDANREAEAGSAAKFSELLGREQEARRAMTRTVEQIEAVDKARNNLARREQQLAKLSAAAVRAQRKDELLGRLATVDQAARDLRQFDAQLGQIRVRPDMVEEIDGLDREIATLDAQLAAAAAQLAVEIKPDAIGQVCIGDDPAAASTSVPVLAPVKIAVADIAVITVTPAENPRQGKRQELDRERSELLATADAATVADAHAALLKRRNLEAERKAVLTQLKALKIEGDPDGAIGKLKREVEEAGAAISQALADTQRPRLPTAQEVDEERLTLAQERADLDARHDSLAEGRSLQQKSLVSVAEEKGSVDSTLKMLRKAIAEDLALCPDAERKTRHAALAADVTKADEAHRTAEAMLEARRLSAPEAAEIERRQLCHDRLEQARENRNEELRQLNGEIGRLRGQIQMAGGEGVGEALAAAREQRMLADRDSTRVQERVATLQLLRDTVEECLSEGREHYYAPVRRHLRPFLHDLFPGAELELGEDFAITGITRQRKEDFARLSDGTQEQIAVLVRLAMGAMLAERGEAAPIILDDALVYSDDERIERMFDALSRAGKNQQIIVLTCRMRSFERLGGHVLRVQAVSDAEQDAA